jgi:hypothetical protein
MKSLSLSHTLIRNRTLDLGGGGGGGGGVIDTVQVRIERTDKQ